MKCQQYAASILFVDDEEDILEIVSAWFSSYFERIYTATSFNDAIKILSSHSVDCVVTDYRMPGKNGLDLISFIQSRFPHLPVILFTANASDRAVVEKLRTGVFDLIEKPLNHYLILNRICNALLLASSEKLLNEFIQYNFPEFQKLQTISEDESIYSRLENFQKVKAVCSTRLLNLNTRKVHE